MKRILFVLLLLMLCLSAVFAANNIVSVDIYPFSVQLIDNYGWGNKYSSSLGWGAKAGYRYHVDKYLLGCDLIYNGYTYKEYTHGAIAEYKLVPKVGGKAVLSDELELNFDFGVGIEVDVSTVVDPNPVVAGSVSMAIALGPGSAITAGFDAFYSFQKTADTSFQSRTWSISPSIGAEYNF